MVMPGRKYQAAGGLYRYGFNGKENHNEVKGEGNQQDYGMRIYDPRLVKFLSIDPITKSYPWYTPYQFAGNKPIWCIDLDGLEDIPATGSNYPQPFSTEQLIKWATTDGFYKGPQSRGETVLLIQDYRVIETKTNRVVNIHKEIVLYQGDYNKPINKILQGNVTFAENGNTGPGRGPQMTGGGTIQFGTQEFKIQMDKLYPDGIPVNDVSIKFGPNSRKLNDEDKVLEKLKPIADFLTAYPETKINISGNTDLSSPPSTIIKSDDEDISVQQLMDGRAQTLNKVLTEKLKVNPTQVNTTPGTQGTNTNGNIKVIQPKAEKIEK
jgi:RHS repeat-associated protein